MELRNATVADLESAFDQAQALFSGNLRLIAEDRGRIVRFSLKVVSSSGSGAHRSASGRKTVSACWHAHRDVFGFLFDLKPDARVSSMMARYEGRESFERSFPQTYYRNAGSLMSPAFYGALCECAPQAPSYADLLARKRYEGGEIITLDQARRIAADWHGGQTSPLYALSSSGAIVSGLTSEIADDLASLKTSGQYGPDEIERESVRLSNLLAFAEANESEDIDPEESERYVLRDHRGDARSPEPEYGE